MRIVRSELDAVAVKPSQYPPADMPEIAFVGRSNVGKSSLLNYICNRRGLARVSGQPGKTRTINFYVINDAFRFVDLPGYGYAKVSKSVTSEWDRMMGSFFESRKTLTGVVHLVDIRHDPSRLDAEMYEYLRSFGLSGIVAATKADKVSGNEKSKNIALIKKTLMLAPDDVIIPVSAFKRTGADLLLCAIERRIAHFGG